MSLADVVADREQQGPEDLAGATLLAEEAERTLTAVLTAREKLVLQMRYGIGGRDALPPELVAARLGLTRERVGQIERGALTKLRGLTATTRLRQHLCA
jgi:RNA polymerase primary sigma factor